MEASFMKMHEYVMTNPHAEFFLVSEEEGKLIASTMIVFKDDVDINKMCIKNGGQLMLFGYKTYFSREVTSITAVYPVDWNELFGAEFNSNYALEEQS
jgi:hypothetical protein